MTLAAALLLAATTPSPAAPSPPLDPERCDGRPVIMAIEGDLKDRARLAAYGAAIRASGLYDRLGGYYLNSPRVAATFEGSAPPTRSLLLARFPCLANARAFWNSVQYRREIMPLRLAPSAGEFTVTVHEELPPPAYMAGRVGSNAYAPGRTGEAAAVAQVPSGERR